MKIRNDYITNSSSSSFILSFKDRDSIYETLKKQFPKKIDYVRDINKYLNELWYEIDTKVEDGLNLSREDLKEIVDDEYDAYWEIMDELEERGMPLVESAKFLLRTEGKQLLTERTEKFFKQLLERIGDDEIIVEVEHGDGGEGEDGVLEQEILPHLECTVQRFSHH